MPLLRLQIRLPRRRGRSLIRWIRRGLTGLRAALALYLGAAAIGGLLPNGVTAEARAEPADTILLINGPIHYDILIPVDRVRDTMPWLARQGIALDHPDVHWVLFGWGARDFYTTTGSYADVSPRAIWRGLTGDSAVRRVCVAGGVDGSWPTVTACPAQMQRMITAISDSFADGAGTGALEHAGFSEFDRFFPGTGRFHLFNSCNVWGGQMMRRARIRFGRWTPTPYAVTLATRRFRQH